MSWVNALEERGSLWLVLVGLVGGGGGFGVDCVVVEVDAELFGGWRVLVPDFGAAHVGEGGGPAFAEEEAFPLIASECPAEDGVFVAGLALEHGFDVAEPHEVAAL